MVEALKSGTVRGERFGQSASTQFVSL